MRAKCRCGYEWEYTGMMIVTTCPCCKTSVRVREKRPVQDEG